MDNNQTIILVDALVYILTLIFWWRKIRALNVGLMVLAIMAISHSGAILYYTILQEFGLLESNIQIWPFVYLYVMIMLCLMPFLKYSGVQRIDDRGIEKLIKLISIFVIIVNIEPILENFKILLTSKSEFSEVYDDMRDGFLDIYSGIGKRFMAWSNHFRLFVPVAFFYYLSKTPRNKFLLIGLGLCALNHILYWINMGTRGGLVTQVFIYSFCFVFLRNIFSNSIVTKIRKLAILLVIAIIPFFAAITLSRFSAMSNSNKTLLGWLLLYSSEGPIKFNTEMWEGPHNTNGDVNLNFVKDLFGMKTFTTYEDRDTYYLAKNGRRIEVFYTYVGDFVSDFGPYGGVLVCLLFYALARSSLKRDGIIPFHYLILIAFLLHFYSIGFASNVYRSYTLQKGLFYMLVLFAIFSIKFKMAKSNHDNEIPENIQ